MELVSLVQGQLLRWRTVWPQWRRMPRGVVSVVGMLLIVVLLLWRRSCPSETRGEPSSRSFKLNQSAFIQLMHNVKANGSPAPWRVPASSAHWTTMSPSQLSAVLFNYTDCPRPVGVCFLGRPFPAHASNMTVHLCQADDRELLHFGVSDLEQRRALLVSLSLDDELQLIDVEFNAGLMSLIAASAGKRVLAVSSSKQSVTTLCQSAVRSELSQLVRIVHADIDLASSNQSAIHLDHLAALVDLKRAILRIDLAGREPTAFRHASQLFSAVHIPIVMMRWSVLREKLLQGATEPETILEFFARRHYTPYGALPGQPLSLAQPALWTDHVFWLHVDYIAF